jgi:uncharacterized protein YkwD
MRARACALIGALLVPLSLAAPARAGDFESAVLAELNRVRAQPQAYARELRRQELAEARYGDDGYGEDGYGYRADRGDPEAAEEAVDELMRQRPLPPLARDGRLAAAARVHVVRQGPRGDVGHGPPGALGQRLQREGLYAGLEAESISYGQRTPREVVRQLVVDAGVPGRGHRRDLLSPAFQAAGVACGRHAANCSMCVIDLAGAIVRR